MFNISIEVQILFQENFLFQISTPNCRIIFKKNSFSFLKRLLKKMVMHLVSIDFKFIFQKERKDEKNLLPPGCFRRRLTFKQIINIPSYRVATLLIIKSEKAEKKLFKPRIKIKSIQLNHNKNKDDNIHKSEALKWKEKRRLTLVECQPNKQNINA